jgi:alpha-tubulin suppressor-like RCC1 family protein
MSTSGQQIRALSQRDVRLVTSLACLLLGIPGCESGDGSTETQDGSIVVEDAAPAGTDGDSESPQTGVEPDAGQPGDAQTDATPLPTAEVAEGDPCETDEQCNDGVYCNGDERCTNPGDAEVAVCQRAVLLPCSANHPCQEAQRACDCADSNKDRDPYVARECGGDDCDDSRDDCYPGATEVCDPDGRDEDCDPMRFNNHASGRDLDGDADGDGRIDQRCRNQDPQTGEWHGGNDCDDHNPSIHPKASEVCDYHDNNCNGYVDEKLREDGTSEHQDGGLMVLFYPDKDRDLYGDSHGDAVLACDFFQPPGYIFAAEGLDCEDGDREFNPDAPEICDGKDNDCDGAIDKDDPGFRKLYFFPDTEVDCVAGREVIVDCPDDTLWCPELGDPIDQGCRRPSTRLTSCRACRTDCKFACGEAGCDEVTKIALGGNHSCALTREGNVACWGQGSLGRLGNDNTKQSLVPVAVNIRDARDLAAGFEHSCATVGEERSLFCWGSNSSGQLGHNLSGEPFSAVPVAVTGTGVTPVLTNVRQVATGRRNTCAVLDDGQLVCFGDPTRGMLSNGVAGDPMLPPVLWPPTLAGRLEYVEVMGIGGWIAGPISDASMVTLGRDHGCLLTRGGKVECWGDNTHGQLGIASSAEPTLYASAVPELSNVSMIAAGLFHTCALLSAGTVSCWGENQNLQLGSQRPDGGPQPVPGLSEVVEIAAGQHFTCARKADGAVSCWGSNLGGQLGSAAPIAAGAGPTPLPAGNSPWLSIATGVEHACARDQDNHVSCWGTNSYGQLGNGGISLAPTPTPRAVLPLSIQ